MGNSTVELSTSTTQFKDSYPSFLQRSMKEGNAEKFQGTSNGLRGNHRPGETHIDLESGPWDHRKDNRL
jgi:hypothetical protein